jgi:hypothetical protein
MNKKIGGVLFLVLMLSMTFVLAGTTKITVRMDNDKNVLVRVKDGDTLIDTPKIKNYPMGLAELSYDTTRSQIDYLILIHKDGEVSDSYTLDDIDVGSDLLVDFRQGVPPSITDLKLESSEEVVNTTAAEEVIVEENVTEGEILEENSTDEGSFDFMKGLSTGKVVFYSTESGFTVFSWVLVGIAGLVVAFFTFGFLKDRNKEEVDKYKHELDLIKKQIRKKIREIKVLKARGMKLKKMIELEEGFLEEKKELGNVEKEIDEEEKGKK